MKFKQNIKYNTISAYVVIVFTICLILVAIIFKYSGFLHYISVIFKVLSPMFWGIAIAYMLNPIMKFIEKYLSKLINKKKEHRIITRTISALITVALFISVIAALVASIIPQIIENIKNITSSLSDYLNIIQNWINGFVESNSGIKELLQGEFVSFKEYVIQYASEIQPKVDNILSIAETGVKFLTGIKDFIIGLVIAVYLLFSKEILLAQAKKIVYAFWSEKKANKMLDISRHINYTFSHFLSGMAFDSVIIGMITFIFMTIFHFPYALLISCIIGITNMIPFFGPFIGAIPSTVLILLSEPRMTIWFVVFILVLQQIDGNILNPAILGDSLGLPALWVMLALLIGGGFFGFIGMIVSVPFFAVFYSLFKDTIQNKLKSKNLPVSTAVYKLHGNIERTAGDEQNLIPDENDDAEEADNI